MRQATFSLGSKVTRWNSQSRVGFNDEEDSGITEITVGEGLSTMLPQVCASITKSVETKEKEKQEKKKVVPNQR